MSILIFTIFIALRVDEVILWNYHLVFLPLYIGMANIFCGLSTKDGVYAYFKAHKIPNTYPTTESFSTKSTATLIYEEITPVTDRPRAKCSTYIWAGTVLSAFVLLAQALNYQGIFATAWCLLVLMVGISLLACCYLSWFPSSKFCNGDKCKGGFALCMLFMYFTWMALFLWSKSEYEVGYFNWYAAFSPWWIIGIVSFGTLGVSWVAFISNRHSSDFWLFAGMIATATIAFFTICAFLILLSYNLDAVENDEPTYPWILVATPMIIFEVYSFCACCFLTGYIHFK